MVTNADAKRWKPAWSNFVKAGAGPSGTCSPRSHSTRLMTPVVFLQVFLEERHLFLGRQRISCGSSGNIGRGNARRPVGRRRVRSRIRPGFRFKRTHGFSLTNADAG